MNLFSLCMPPLLLSAELLHFLIAPPLFPLMLFPQLAFSLLLLSREQKHKKIQHHYTMFLHKLGNHVSAETQILKLSYVNSFDYPSLRMIFFLN